MRIRRSLVMLAVAAATVVATAGPGAAAPAPVATPLAESAPVGCLHEPPVPPDVYVQCSVSWTYRTWRVDVWWGFAYNPSNNHLRALGQLAGNSASIRVRADALNLGDRNGILVSTPGVAMGTLNLQTDPAVDCHRPNGVYLSNLHYSIRWPDGSLTSGQQTGQLSAAASFICV